MVCDNADSMVFFFKQKTAYEMRISDWSSDVCSSDLAALRIEGFRALLVNVNAEADRQIAEAKARAAEGEQAAAEAEAEAARLQARLTDAQRQLQAAKTDPQCADHLRLQLFATITTPSHYLFLPEDRTRVVYGNSGSIGV